MLFFLSLEKHKASRARCAGLIPALNTRKKRFSVLPARVLR
jgi:hypothetical protein